MTTKLLTVTLGDPFSINIEAVAPLLREVPADLTTVVIGSRWQFDDQTRRLEITAPVLRPVQSLADLGASGGLHFYNIEQPAHCRPAETLDEKARGALGALALESLSQLAWPKHAAVVTGPVSKETMHAAGYPHPGQTEYFENLWGEKGIMILAGPKLRVGLATNHLALKDVAGRLGPDLIERKLRSFAKTLNAIYGITKPRLAVCGLNPHCSDGGLFGDEERRIIEPAVAAFTGSQEMIVTGPLPADTIFFRALNGEFDGVLAMYHDQGLGPLKTAHFYDAVNVTGGLRHLRVSPDHGPAKDLFLKKQANLVSFQNAFRLAREYLSH